MKRVFLILTLFLCRMKTVLFYVVLASCLILNACDKTLVGQREYAKFGLNFTIANDGGEPVLMSEDSAFEDLTILYNNEIYRVGDDPRGDLSWQIELTMDANNPEVFRFGDLPIGKGRFVISYKEVKWEIRYNALIVDYDQYSGDYNVDVTINDIDTEKTPYPPYSYILRM